MTQRIIDIGCMLILLMMAVTWMVVSIMSHNMEPVSNNFMTAASSIFAYLVGRGKRAVDSLKKKGTGQ